MLELVPTPGQSDSAAACIVVQHPRVASQAVPQLHKGKGQGCHWGCTALQSHYTSGPHAHMCNGAGLSCEGVRMGSFAGLLHVTMQHACRRT